MWLKDSCTKGWFWGWIPRTQTKETKQNMKTNELGPVAHICNPSYLGGGDEEDHSSRPALANSPRAPISKITRAK
jgi:hypothetical protein